MCSNIIAVFAVLLGLLCIFKGLDTLTPWRADFFAIIGLLLFLSGAIRIYLRTRGPRSKEPGPQ